MRPTATVSAAAVLFATLCPSAVAQTQPQPTPAVDANTGSSVARPFGAGQPIEVQCDEPDGYVFVARGVVDEQRRFPDPFTKIGRIPVKLELPAGVYTLLVEGESFTSVSTTFEVRHQPVSVRVHAGSQGLRDLSTLSLALGTAALLAGGVLEVSGTGEGDSDKKHKITIPLFIAGGVTFAGGLGMYFASSSSAEHDGYVPQRGAARRLPRTHTLGVRGSF